MTISFVSAHVIANIETDILKAPVILPVIDRNDGVLLAANQQVRLVAVVSALDERRRDPYGQSVRQGVVDVQHQRLQVHVTAVHGFALGQGVITIKPILVEQGNGALISWGDPRLRKQRIRDGCGNHQAAYAVEAGHTSYQTLRLACRDLSLPLQRLVDGFEIRIRTGGRLQQAVKFLLRRGILLLRALVGHGQNDRPERRRLQSLAQGIGHSHIGQHQIVLGCFKRIVQLCAVLDKLKSMARLFDCRLPLESGGTDPNSEDLAARKRGSSPDAQV